MNRLPILAAVPAILLNVSAVAHESPADHAAMAQDSLLAALSHRLFGGHHMAETIGLVVAAVVGVAAVAFLARRRS